MNERTNIVSCINNEKYNKKKERQQKMRVYAWKYARAQRRMKEKQETHSLKRAEEE